MKKETTLAPVSTFEVSVEGMTATFREPLISDWRYAIKKLAESKSAFQLAIVKSTFVGGDAKILQSPYIEQLLDSADFMEAFDYPKAEISRDGALFVVTVEDKQCKLRPCSIEAVGLAERDNANDIAYKTEQNLIERLFVEGDEEFKSTKQLKYFMPLAQVVKELRDKLAVSVKKN